MLAIIFTSDQLTRPIDAQVQLLRKSHPGIKIAVIHDAHGDCQLTERVEFFRQRQATAGTVEHYINAMQAAITGVPGVDVIVRPHGGAMPKQIETDLAFHARKPFYWVKVSVWTEIIKEIQATGVEKISGNVIAVDGSVRDDLFFKRVAMERLKLPGQWHAPPPVDPLVLKCHKSERGGQRAPLHKPTLKVEACVVIADLGVHVDLERLIPTYMRHMPEHIPLYLVGDLVSITRAAAIAHELGQSHRLHCREWLTAENMAMAEDKLKNLTVQADYWKPGPIWWKLEGMRRIIEEIDGGVLLLDSDIVFINDFTEVEFPGCDLAMSPFFWPDPELPVPPHGDAKNRRVGIANRDGHINAGFALVGNPAVMDLWMELYEKGVGGFYEQWVMKFLPTTFHCGYFSYLQNHGSWRRERPYPNTQSLHFHLRINTPNDWHDACQDVANDAVDAARAHFGIEPLLLKEKVRQWRDVENRNHEASPIE